MTNNHPALPKLLAAVNCIAQQAGELILPYQANISASVTTKADNSPVTQADRAANTFIVTQLAALTPNTPIVAEESHPIGMLDSKDYYWLVDPLDGTKEFIAGRDEFTVNIALVYQGIPVLGSVYAPKLKSLYFAHQAGNAYRQIGTNAPEKLPVQKETSDELTVVASLSHNPPETKAYIDQLKQQHASVNVKYFGSSLKLCAVAEGSADLYPRFAPTMPWDTAAAHAIVLEAGGQVLSQPDQLALTYLQPYHRNPFFIVQRA